MFVSIYRCGAAPDSHRLPFSADREDRHRLAQHIVFLWLVNTICGRLPRREIAGSGRNVVAMKGGDGRDSRLRLPGSLASRSTIFAWCPSHPTGATRVRRRSFGLLVASAWACIGRSVSGRDVRQPDGFPLCSINRFVSVQACAGYRRNQANIVERLAAMPRARPRPPSGLFLASDSPHLSGGAPRSTVQGLPGLSPNGTMAGPSLAIARLLSPSRKRP